MLYKPHHTALKRSDITTEYLHTTNKTGAYVSKVWLANEGGTGPATVYTLFAYESDKPGKRYHNQLAVIPADNGAKTAYVPEGYCRIAGAFSVDINKVPKLFYVFYQESEAD